MSHQAIDQALADLATVSEQAVTQADAADAHAKELDDACEALLEQRAARGVSGCQPDPRFAAASLRRDLASKAARQHHAAARELVAWWADLATVAVVAAAFDRPLRPARAAAADPAIGFTREDLRQLPAVPEHERKLAELGARMSSTSLAPRPRDDDFAAAVADHAVRVGLLIDVSEDGQLVAVEDGSPQARRCRLWGNDWIDHQVPLLPDADELADLLRRRGVPADTVAAVHDATAAVADALDAAGRARELAARDSPEAPLTAAEAAECEALLDQAEGLTGLLARYARTLAGSLPAVRATTATP
jgi:hypothetical protein